MANSCIESKQSNRHISAQSFLLSLIAFLFFRCFSEHSLGYSAFCSEVSRLSCSDTSRQSSVLESRCILTVSLLWVTLYSYPASLILEKISSMPGVDFSFNLCGLFPDLKSLHRLSKKKEKKNGEAQSRRLTSNKHFFHFLSQYLR